MLGESERGSGCNKYAATPRRGTVTRFYSSALPPATPPLPPPPNPALLSPVSRSQAPSLSLSLPPTHLSQITASIAVRAQSLRLRAVTNAVRCIARLGPLGLRSGYR